MKDKMKLADDIFMVPWDQGNGVIRREIWGDRGGKASHYSLSYINQEIFPGDGGRVLGYDYCNGNLTSHLMGNRTSASVSSLAELEELFDIKWNNLAKESGPMVFKSEPHPDEISQLDGSDYPEIKGMKLTITRGSSADFFRRGKELASRLDRGEHPEPEKVVIFGHQNDLCYSNLPKKMGG